MNFPSRPDFLTTTLFGVVLLLASIAPALADTIDLTCTRPNLQYKFFVRIDLGAKRAVAWISTIPEAPSETDPAVITDDEVTWTYTSGAGTTRFTLDRTNGALSLVDPEGNRDSWMCVRSSRVF